MNFTRTTLRDGRPIRPLYGTFTQLDMFKLRNQLLSSETIMSIREHDDAITSGAYKAINIDNWWRTREYGFSRKGFERELTIPFGAEIIYTEDVYIDNRMKLLIATLRIPKGIDVEFEGINSAGNSIRVKCDLREAYGLGVINDISKLELHLEESTPKLVRYTISLSNSFDPRIDLSVVDVMREQDRYNMPYALVDERGIPLRTKPASSECPDARYPFIRTSDRFEPGATGWHGSFTRIAGNYGLDGGRGVGAGAQWMLCSSSGVGVVGQLSNSGQLSIYTTPDGTLVITGATPDQILGITKLLQGTNNAESK